MGMFDWVRARCPECGGEIEEQSKAGPCILADYTLDNAPASVLEDMAREEWFCTACDTRWRVEVQGVVRAWLERPTD